MVIQPRGIELIMSNWVVTTSIRDELSFYYSYDDKQRMIIKKVTRCRRTGWFMMPGDRLVMTQDSNLKSKPSGW